MDIMTDWQPDVMFADPSTPAGLRIMLQARYQHLVLKFLAPPVTESGLYEASWIGGKAESDTEEDLLRIVCEELQDCGTARHDWITVSKIRDPANEDNILRTQRLECTYCDTRERVITVSSPRDLPAPARAAPRSPCPHEARPADHPSRMMPSPSATVINSRAYNPTAADRGLRAGAAVRRS